MKKLLLLLLIIFTLSSCEETPIDITLISYKWELAERIETTYYPETYKDKSVVISKDTIYRTSDQVSEIELYSTYNSYCDYNGVYVSGATWVSQTKLITIRTTTTRKLKLLDN